MVSVGELTPSPAAPRTRPTANGCTWSNQASGMDVSGELRRGGLVARRRGGARRHLEGVELLGFPRE
jgi:hypothetical protein